MGRTRSIVRSLNTLGGILDASKMTRACVEPLLTKANILAALNHP